MATPLTQYEPEKNLALDLLKYLREDGHVRLVSSIISSGQVVVNINAGMPSSIELRQHARFKNDDP